MPTYRDKTGLNYQVSKALLLYQQMVLRMLWLGDMLVPYHLRQIGIMWALLWASLEPTLFLKGRLVPLA